MKSGSTAPTRTFSIDILEKLNIKTLLLDEETGQIWLPPGMQNRPGRDCQGMDRRASRQAARRENFHLRRQCRWRPVHDRSSGRAKRLGGCIRGPARSVKTLAILHVGPGAVATSSITKRAWRQGDRQQHHLIDPRSGEPAITDWLSVTVIAPQAATAEVFAKVLLIAGNDQAMDILDTESEIAFIAVDRQGSLWGSQNSKEYINV